MSLLNQYVELEKQLKEIQTKLKTLETNKDMKTELEFKEQIEKVMDKYGKDADDVVELMKPRYPKKNALTRQVRKPRKLKIYKNENTGEVVETYGGNNKVLREWKDEYGADVVDSWLINAEVAQ